MVLAFLGDSVDEHTVAEACGTTRRGTTLAEAAAALEQFGLAGDLSGIADIDRLSERVLCEEPVIVSQRVANDLGRATNHTVVVIHVDDSSVFVLDPATGSERSLAQREFLSAWRASGSESLVVYRP